MSTAELQNTCDFGFEVRDYKVFEHETVFRCDVLLSQEEDGFSAQCTNLPGVISQGDDEADAMRNICDAFRETILYYRENNLAIPFGKVDVERTPNCREKFVDVRI